MFCFLSYWCWQDCWCEVDTDLLSVHRLSGQSRRTEMLVVTALTSRPARGFQNCPALSVFFLFPPARVLGCPGLSWAVLVSPVTPGNTKQHSGPLKQSHWAISPMWNIEMIMQSTGRPADWVRLVLSEVCWMSSSGWWLSHGGAESNTTVNISRSTQSRHGAQTGKTSTASVARSNNRAL